jgi:hypothetical protein
MGCSNSTDLLLKLFNVVLVSARKPKFYTRQRSFRLFDPSRKQVQVRVAD